MSHQKGVDGVSKWTRFGWIGWMDSVKVALGNR